jgi:hypothetical protein
VRPSISDPIQEITMKILAAILFGSVVLAAAPAFAQDKDKGNMGDMDHHDAAPAHHAMMHRHRHVSYTRNYKTDQEEEEQTKQLNAQYRGVDRSDIH